MNRKQWKDGEGHPPAGLLLLHLEHELDGRCAKDVIQHVGGCAECRSLCAQLDLGMLRFDAFRESVTIPDAAPRTQLLRERLAAASTGSRRHDFAARIRGYFQFDSPRRLAYAFGGAALLLIVWLSVNLSTPGQSVYASQILEDARQASDSLIAHSKMLNQKVRLRRGALVIEKSAHHGRQLATEVREPAVNSSFQQTLDEAHIDLNDPLNAGDFADWRAAQKKHADSVKETTQSVTITTSVAGAEITEESLTLSRMSWRPIARSVEVRGEAPIEISEVSYEIGEFPALIPGSAAVSMAASAVPSKEAALAPAEVSVGELENAELDLREAFHSVGADVSASPEIWRSEHTVFYRAFPETPGQAEAIRKAASRVANVRESNMQTTPLGQRHAGTEPAPATLQLSSVLENRFASAQEAKSFLDSLQTRSKHVLGEAAALNQLGKRYPVDAIRALPAGVARAGKPSRSRYAFFAAARFGGLCEVDLSDAGRDGARVEREGRGRQRQEPAELPDVAGKRGARGAPVARAEQERLASLCSRPNRKACDAARRTLVEQPEGQSFS